MYLQLALLACDQTNRVLVTPYTCIKKVCLVTPSRVKGQPHSEYILYFGASLASTSHLDIRRDNRVNEYFKLFDNLSLNI